jgi:hypothetical protein
MSRRPARQVSPQPKAEAQKKPTAAQLARFYAEAAALMKAAGERKREVLPHRIMSPANLPEMPPALKKAVGGAGMAQDSALSETYAWARRVEWGGYGFMGYPLLSELAQITEFRRPSEILANEMTRKWGKFVSTSEDADKSDKIKALHDGFDEFNVQELFRKAFEKDNFFGRSHIYIDAKTVDEDKRADDDKPLALGANLGKGDLRGLRLVEPIWTYPNEYNSTDPRRADFYEPQSWFVQGAKVHSSRLLTFCSRPVPDVLKPSYMFGGVPLTQLLWPYVENWLRTRDSVSDLIHAFSVMVLLTDGAQYLQPGGAAALVERLNLFNMARDNLGIFVAGKDTEDFKNVSASVSGLDALLAASVEQMAYPSGIPLVKLLGVTPSGLNASSDGEIRVFYDSIVASQERIGTPGVRRIGDVMQTHLFGEVDPDITWQWNPLWEMSEKEAAEVRKINAETAQIEIDSGVLDPHEERQRIANAEDTLYPGLDIDEMPDREEVEGEVLSVKGRPLDEEGDGDSLGGLNWREAGAHGEGDVDGTARARRREAAELMRTKRSVQPA